MAGQAVGPARTANAGPDPEPTRVDMEMPGGTAGQQHTSSGGLGGEQRYRPSSGSTARGKRPASNGQDEAAEFMAGFRRRSRPSSGPQPGGNSTGGAGDGNSQTS